VLQSNLLFGCEMYALKSQFLSRFVIKITSFDFCKFDSTATEGYLNEIVFVFVVYMVA